VASFGGMFNTYNVHSDVALEHLPGIA
jgi:hypothetical protein